jgi:hypothetical protein
VQQCQRGAARLPRHQPLMGMPEGTLMVTKIRMGMVKTTMLTMVQDITMGIIRMMVMEHITMVMAER